MCGIYSCSHGYGETSSKLCLANMFYASSSFSKTRLCIYSGGANLMYDNVYGSGLEVVYSLCDAVCTLDCICLFVHCSGLARGYFGDQNCTVSLHFQSKNTTEVCAWTRLVSDR